MMVDIGTKLWWIPGCTVMAHGFPHLLWGWIVVTKSGQCSGGDIQVAGTCMKLAAVLLIKICETNVSHHNKKDWKKSYWQKYKYTICETKRYQKNKRSQVKLMKTHWKPCWAFNLCRSTKPFVKVKMEICPNDWVKAHWDITVGRVVCEVWVYSGNVLI